jgi:glycoprotein-N-acetylgalactosamine 3-beta-galactosyltransferase
MFTLQGKTRAAFMHIYQQHRDQFDWFLKADDDTYVHVGNLRRMLASHSPTESVHFGCKFATDVRTGYMSGGAGYVLSREALRRFAADHISESPKCRRSDFGVEDIEMGRCMGAIGVAAGDSRDSAGMHRWLPQHPIKHVVPKVLQDEVNWLPTYMSFQYIQVGL